jgi:hypothetical protein
MKNEDYPQDISPQETELKFERLLIDGIGALMGSQIAPKPVPVVARVLSPSDVLIKIYDLKESIRYSHRRWGYSKTLGNPNNCRWYPLGTPIPDLKQFVIDFSFEAHEEMFRDDIAGVSFKYRAA